MKVYLIQHGESLPESIDPARPLSEKGRKDVEHIASFLEKAGVKVEKIFHSGKTRALQTAEIFGQAVQSNQGIAKMEGLAPNDPIDLVLRELLDEQRDVMIVGHLPFLAKLAFKLLGVPETSNVLTFQQGGVVCLGRGEGKRWSVTWMIVPGLLERYSPQNDLRNEAQHWV